MFTGIIEELGRVREIEKRGEDARIVIEARTVTEGARDGDSIAVNGVCLTALDVRPDSFAADVSKETLFRSTLGRLHTGSPVNLEASVTPITRLGATSCRATSMRVGNFSAPKAMASHGPFELPIRKRLRSTWFFKGSVAVEGISLTIAELTDDYLNRRDSKDVGGHELFPSEAG